MESVVPQAQVVGEVVVASNCAIVFVTLHAVELDIAESDVGSFAVGTLRVGEQSHQSGLRVSK